MVTAYHNKRPSNSINDVFTTFTQWLTNFISAVIDKPYILARVCSPKFLTLSDGVMHKRLVCVRSSHGWRRWKASDILVCTSSSECTHNARTDTVHRHVSRRLRDKTGCLRCAGFVKTSPLTSNEDLVQPSRCWFIQDNHLSGKPGNVWEFDSCQENVTDFTKSQESVWRKTLVREKLPKTVYCKLHICIHTGI